MEMKIQSIIRELRIEKGMTQEDVAKHLGVPRSTYTKWEKNITPDYSKVVKLAELYGVTTDYLFGNNYNVTKDMPILVFSQDDVDLVKRVRALPPVGQKMMINTLENLEAMFSEPSTTKEDLA
jgi:transcriptional regulator with XRE-family HTH domain